MKRENNSEDFLQKIFERSTDPLAQLERINSIVPSFFVNEKNVASVNKRLDSYGYQINDNYISEMRSQFQMFGHPSCGVSGDYGSGHPSCGISDGYGSSHPSCGISGGYGSGHPSCGISGGHGNGHPSCGISGGHGSGHPSCGISGGHGSGHPSCCSSNERGKSLLLIRKNNSDGYHEIRN